MMGGNKTVVKSLEILKLFYEHDRLTLQEMVEISNIPKTSVYRQVKSLEEMGLLTRDIDGKYRLGLIFIKLGQLVADRLDIRQVALPFMHKLRDEMGEAVNLIVREGNEAIYIEKVDTKKPVRLYTRVGRRSPLYAGACSRILLAFMPPEEAEQYIAQTELKAIASGTITDKERLRQVIVESQKNGYSVSYSELEDHSAAVAAPIYNHKGEVVAGLSMAGLEAHYAPDKLPPLIKKIKQTAREISLQLGWRDE
ncbi:MULTISPECIES: IclR family transcriptional regulator [Aneurinibacillus]|uniref:IclR family transcriptional regulator n=2 Tax=Aneurinibacillus thermoaerophilus TaxID=143495 RepID=A0ABX8YBI7_ANETH|nr:MULTISPECIES: IclR family transcriptional regulator [Aneurinibacillus]MED0675389.1 IclR family transcriptional regulator [Aneurinibacillus thermoaerophilus]MED0735423.1 IclR family transcriptional regulator [Aneurinibacillus thermoaerophilus]MED0757327.1 IclR family transcriptional regulator [Aneurinibacillus thermoaerophilus]MED0761458.1 IclR family transcriptional regulator [Aneurinibacillus thermoaerophilus]QYY42694.1 IclR family transcriptional regulator [Aneurinibacillus thermoaerophil